MGNLATYYAAQNARWVYKLNHLSKQPEGVNDEQSY